MNGNRRAFLRDLGLTLAWGMALPVTGCLFALNPKDPPPPVEGDEPGSITDNHLHAAVITAEMLEAGKGLILDITGESTHPHFVTLSAGDLEAIRRGPNRALRSTHDLGHDHLVTFNAA